MSRFRVCPSCHTQTPAQAEFCTQCGTWLGEQPSRPAAGMTLVVLAGLCLLALLLLAGGLYLFQQGRVPPLMVSLATEKPTIPRQATPTSWPSVAPDSPLALSTSTSPAPTATPRSTRAQISSEIYFAAIRQSPGYSGKNDKVDVLAKVPAGDVVEILLPEPQSADGLAWWYVSWGGVRGWMADHTGSGKTILVFLP